MQLKCITLTTVKQCLRSLRLEDQRHQSHGELVQPLHTIVKLRQRATYTSSNAS